MKRGVYIGLFALAIIILASSVNAAGYWTNDSKSATCISGYAMTNYDCTGGCDSSNSRIFCSEMPVRAAVLNIFGTNDAKKTSCGNYSIAIGFDCTGGCGSTKMKLICANLTNATVGVPSWTSDTKNQHNCTIGFVSGFDCTGDCGTSKMMISCAEVVGTPCTPSCTNADGTIRECGDNNCGGTCGACDYGHFCNTNKKCEQVPGEPNNQTILRISAVKDAFGANATNQSFTHPIRYNNIFGMYYPLFNAHACNGRNTVLNLEGGLAFAPNADISESDSESICYGNLNCTLRTDCVSAEKMVVALNSTANASLALTNDSSYIYKICCMAKYGEYYWLDKNNARIDSATSGTKARLVAKTGLWANININFTIYAKNSSGDSIAIRKDVIVPTDTNGAASYDWLITDTDLDQALVANTGENSADFYFIASYDGRDASDNGLSRILKVSYATTSCNNFFMNSGEEDIITYCDDYNYITGTSSDKKSQCEDDCNDVASNEKDILSGNLSLGERIINDKCEWSSSESKCIYSYDISNVVINYPVDNTVNGVCKQYVNYLTDCKDGYRQASYTYKESVNGVEYTKSRFAIQFPNSNWDCLDDSTMQIPCPSSVQATMPFFTLFNVICAMSVIALIYAFLLFKREFK